MINLIPPVSRKQVLKEYWLRVSSVMMCIAATVALITSLLLSPSYVLVTNRGSDFAESAAEALTKSEKYDELIAEVDKTNNQAVVLLRDIESIKYTELMSRIEELAGNKIKISEIRFEGFDSKTNKSTVSIVGVASDRESLANYRTSLDNDRSFTNIVLPISNLAKDVDIQFSLLVEIVTKQS